MAITASPEDELLAVPEETAARLANISVRRLRAWNRHGWATPTVSRDISPRRRVRLYKFGDLIESAVVGELVRRDAHPRRVGSLVMYLRSQDYRLDDLRFAVDSGWAYWRRHDHEPWTGGPAHDQTIIPDVLDLRAIRDRVRVEARARLGEPGQIEHARGRRGGRAVFAGTRIPVDAVQEFLEDGATVRRILKAYPELRPEDVEAARRARC